MGGSTGVRTTSEWCDRVSTCAGKVGRSQSRTRAEFTDDIALNPSGSCTRADSADGVLAADRGSPSRHTPAAGTLFRPPIMHIMSIEASIIATGCTAALDAPGSSTPSPHGSQAVRRRVGPGQLTQVSANGNGPSRSQRPAERSCSRLTTALIGRASGGPGRCRSADSPSRATPVRGRHRHRQVSGHVVQIQTRVRRCR
jgi:hypothetical protein